MAFPLVQILYWLALSTWFGGVLFIAIAAPIIFRTVREANPIMTSVLSVNLEGQHGTLLAGTIVSNILHFLTRIELGCAAAMLIALVSQFFLLEMTEQNVTSLALRLLIFVCATGLVIYDWLVVWPRIMKSRQEYLDHADEPEVANPAKDEF